MILPLLGTLILTSLFSCGVDRWPEYYPETGRDIWIDSVMRQEYLWYRDMPSPAAPDYFQKPEAFLKKAVASMDNGFSKRTLQYYRSSGRLAYSQIGSKIYYKSSDIERIIADSETQNQSPKQIMSYEKN